MSARDSGFLVNLIIFQADFVFGSDVLFEAFVGKKAPTMQIYSLD